MSYIERRIDALEQRGQAGRGKVVVWYPSSGDPKPEVGKNDVLLRVVYDPPEVGDDERNAES